MAVVPRLRANEVAATQVREDQAAANRKSLAAGAPGIDIDNMRHALAKAGLKYLDETPV